jgi:hypothetical protein
MKTRYTLPTLACILLCGCISRPSATRIPNWALNPDAHYPAEQYLTAIGEGDTLRAAEANAFNRLAGRFKTDIQSTQTLNDNAAETFGTQHAYEKTSEFQSAIQLQTSETLLNVQTLHQHRDARGRIYALIALKRPETARLYEHKIEKNSERIQSLQGDDPYKLKTYAKARQALILGLANQQLLDQLQIIYPPSAALSQPPYSLDLLRIRAAQATSAVRFNIDMPGNQAAPFRNQIATVLSRRGFTESSLSDLRISGSVNIHPASFLRADLNTVRYRILLNVKDQLGETLITLQKEGRESHLTPEEALLRAERTVNQLIEKELTNRLNELLDSLSGQNS